MELPKWVISVLNKILGNRYVVHQVLGEGGFGIVYLVLDKIDNNIYALKTFKDEYFKDIESRKRFIKEALLWINLDKHPNIVRAFYIDEIEGRQFIKLEYIPKNRYGLNTLTDYLFELPPDLKQATTWAIQFCYAMEYAYSKGIRAHRDIKPDNILITQNKQIKVSDFGIAGAVIETAHNRSIYSVFSNRIYFSCQTIEGIGFGTPAYMPPEQFTSANKCDERSDIYSFGIVLFQMASQGKLPFEVIVKHENEENALGKYWYEMFILHSNAKVPRLKSKLFPIIKKCLNKKPTKRYSFRELRLELERLLKKVSGEILEPPSLEYLDFIEWNNKGLSYENIGSYDDAVLCYKKAVEINPTYDTAWANMGFVFGERLENPIEAMKCYEKAFHINPTSANSWNNRGMGFSGIRKHQEAIKCYENALKIDPNYYTAFINMGIEYMHLLDWKKELNCYDSAIQINPKSDTAWRLKGSRLSVLKQYNEAKECFLKAIDINPRDSTTWEKIGHLYKNLKDYKKALTCYDKALQINPILDELLYSKGSLYEKLEMFNEALECFEQMIRINKRDEVAWECKIDILISLGNTQRVLDSFKEALENIPDSTDLWWLMGEYLIEQNRINEAVTAYKNLIKNATEEDANVKGAFNKITELQQLIK